MMSVADPAVPDWMMSVMSGAAGNPAVARGQPAAAPVGTAARDVLMPRS
jgi:hypothetical protein